jgi:peptidoglycan L-alanyl-D-glutamate endopeptidase CwlK
VLFRQRLYRAAGLYLGKLDGIYGPLTDAASLQWEGLHDLAGEDSPGEWDPATSRRLRTLLPDAHLLARRCLLTLWQEGLHPRVVSATRSYPEQDHLFRVGRRGVAGERIVTRARAGESRHNFGIAFDLGLFTLQGAYLQESPDYDRLGALWCPPGVVWGGAWTSLRDTPHYELDMGLSTAGLRGAFEGRAPWPRSEAA